MASRTPVPSFVPALKGCVNILPDSIERDWGWVPSIASGDAADLIVQEPIIQEAIFDSCRLSDVSIIETRKVEDHTVYVIRVVVGDCQWLVARRYREFDDLHEILVKQYNVEKKLLPPKKVFRSKTEHYTSLRKVKLEKYLKELIRILPSPPLELLKFLQYPLYDVMSIIQQMSATFCNQSATILSSGGFISLTPVQVYCIQRRLQIPIETSINYDKDDITQLYDFFYQLQKLKVAPALNQTVTLTADVMVDLAQFKSLISLRLEALEVEYCVGLELIYTQLVCLEVYRSKSVLWKFLVVDSMSSDDVKGQSDINHQSSHDLDDSLEGQNGLTDDVIKKSCHWPHLQRLIFKYNNLERIDESLRLLPSLKELDLSHNTIDTIENLSELTELTALDLGYNQISRLEQLSSKLGNISKLNLAHNQVTSLEGLKKIFSLVYLNLSQNSIVDIKEVEHLSSLDCLEYLLLKDNPLTKVDDYRIKVFKLLPNTQKQLSLDGLEATAEELDSMGVQQSSDDTTDYTECMQPQQQQQQQQQLRRSPLSGKKMTPLTEDVDCGSLSQAAALKIKMETMRKEGGDKWLSMLNAEKDQKSHKSSPRKKHRKGKSSKKKKTEESNSCELAEPEVLEVSAPPAPAPAPPPTPPPPLFQKCSLPLPSLDSDLLHKFFAHLQATKQAHNDEVLLHVLWCSCVLWSSPDHERDVVVLVTSKSVHILSVTSTYHSSFSWETDNLPLVPLHSIEFGELKQVVIGLQKQLLRLETNHLEDITVLLIRNGERTTILAETLKAAMDSEQVKYNIYTSTELQKKHITGDVCSIIVLDEIDESVLKKQLVQEDVVDQLSSQQATSYSTTLSLDESIQAKVISTAAATSVLGYFCVSVMQEGDTEFCYRTLVITDEKLFMCDEDHLCWPPPLSMNVTPITNKVQVLQSELLSDVTKLEVCREPCLVGDTRNGVHGVMMLFSHTGEFGEKSETGWYFCLYGVSQLESFVTVVESSPISVPVGNTTSLLWPELASRYPSINMKTFSTVVNAKTVPATSETLATSDHDVKINLNEVTFDKQQEHFHKHVSQFPSQEKVKFTFSCTCIPFTASNTRIQTFIFVSTQAIYLLTDPHSMKQWIEDGGKCPFTSHSYGNQEHHDKPLCFQYVAFQQLKDINVGLFFQFFRINGGKSSSTFTFITQNYDITNKFLEALPSMRPREDSVDDTFTQLLTQYSYDRHKTDEGRPFSTPLPVNDAADDVIICKTTYQEPNALLSILSESPTGADTMILKYMVVELMDDTITTTTCSMVLTAHKLYIVGEDYIHWPPLSFAFIPETPQYSILKSCTLHDIVRVETKRRQACSFTIVCTEGKLKLPDNPPPLELSDDDSLISELMESIKIDKAVKRLSHSATASISAIRGLATWHLIVQSYEERERFLRVLATAYEDDKHEKLLVTVT